MKQYLLSIYQPDGDPPPPETLEPIMRDVQAVNAELRAAGAWVFAARHPDFAYQIAGLAELAAKLTPTTRSDVSAITRSAVSARSADRAV